MKILGVIPSRMAASRFPGKPMIDIMGMPMIEHCYIRSKMCSELDEVIVATCDQQIIDHIEGIGGKAIMTKNTHERPSERTAEALLNIESIMTGSKFDVVVMIQGDEPLVKPEMISHVVNPLLKGDKMVSNLMITISSKEDIENENYVKVVVDLQGKALYMSREPIPSPRKFKGSAQYFKQLGLIAFTREALLKFVELDSSPLEIVESVDMNRFLEHGIPVHMEETKFLIDAVDTPGDLIRVKNVMKNDSLFQSYRRI
jgi:3-deoxy-manno-octulosonate cytidylyltransferase (CMP-KDO synthetase)